VSRRRQFCFWAQSWPCGPRSFFHRRPRVIHPGRGHPSVTMKKMTTATGPTLCPTTKLPTPRHWANRGMSTTRRFLPWRKNIFFVARREAVAVTTTQSTLSRGVEGFSLGDKVGPVDRGHFFIAADGCWTRVTRLVETKKKYYLPQPIPPRCHHRPVDTESRRRGFCSWTQSRSCGPRSFFFDCQPWATHPGRDPRRRR